MRPVDPETVEAIAESVEVMGLLHPIGVKPAPEGGADTYTLVYGLHRLEAVARCAERGVPDAGSILAVVFPPDMADDDCRAAEVVENLMRRELSPEQEAAHRAWLAAYRAKEIEAAREAKKESGTGETFEKSLPENGRPAKRGRPEEAASKVARELGLSKEAVNQSVTRAAKITGRARRDFDAATPEEKMTIAREAVSRARPKEKTPGARRPPKPRGADAEPSEGRQEGAPPAPSPEPEPVTARPVDAPGEDATPAPAPEPVQEETGGGATLEGASPRRLEEAWAAASEGDRAGFVLAHEAEIRRIIAADTRRTREAVVDHPDLEGDAFYYRSIPDLPTAEQSAALRDTARRLGIEPRPPCAEAGTPAH
jgi:ParB-like chromosome segregation protein Spo0J